MICFRCITWLRWEKYQLSHFSVYCEKKWFKWILKYINTLWWMAAVCVSEWERERDTTENDVSFTFSIGFFNWLWTCTCAHSCTVYPISKISINNTAILCRTSLWIHLFCVVVNSFHNSIWNLLVEINEFSQVLLRPLLVMLCMCIPQKKARISSWTIVLNLKVTLKSLKNRETQRDILKPIA